MATRAAWRRCGFVVVLVTAATLFCPWLPVQANVAANPPAGECHHSLPGSTPVCCALGHHQISHPEAAATAPALACAGAVLQQQSPASFVPATCFMPAPETGSPPGRDVLRI